MTFERTDRDFIKNVSNEQISDPKFAKVKRVYEHREQPNPSNDNEGDDSNFEIDVVTDDEEFGERAAPLSAVGSDHIEVPQVGDTVVLDYLDSEGDDPIVRGVGSTVDDRPPVGRAGMSRDRYESGKSAVGTGNMYFTGYTERSRNPAEVDKDFTIPERSWIQIGKHDPTPGPIKREMAGMLIEMRDNPLNDEASITLRGNQVDQNSNEGIAIDLDFTTGDLELRAENSTGEFGVNFNTKTGEFTLIDQNGYGIESDGQGNFTWHYESIEHSQGTTTNL